MRIAPATAAELPSIMAITEQAGSAAHWSEQQWRDIFQTQIPRRLCWVAWPERTNPGQNAQADAPRGAVAGFLVAQCSGPDWELENIAVASGFRRHGVGAALLSTLLEAARDHGAERVLLEVRASNDSAIALYRRAGFAPLGRRSGYYENPTEDALILARQM